MHDFQSLKKQFFEYFPSGIVLDFTIKNNLKLVDFNQNDSSQIWISLRNWFLYPFAKNKNKYHVCAWFQSGILAMFIMPKSKEGTYHPSYWKKLIHYHNLLNLRKRIQQEKTLR